MLQRSMVEVAYELLSKKQGAQKFNKFWTEVSNMLSMTEEEKDQNHKIKELKRKDSLHVSERTNKTNNGK